MKNTTTNPLEVTYNTRVNIGFLPEYEMWKNQPATFTDNELTINGHPVMEDWEDGYMNILAQIATQNGGTVLEVGFGMGISAHYIQNHSIQKHIIIEANGDVFNKLKIFSKQATKPVEAIFGFWQDAIQTIPDKSVSGILFDTYPLTENEIHQNHFSFFNEAYRVLKPGGILTYYSDEIDTYSQKHRESLVSAGFSKINKTICEVSPPLECKYWTHNTILAPIVTK